MKWRTLLAGGIISLLGYTPLCAQPFPVFTDDGAVAGVFISNLGIVTRAAYEPPGLYGR